ncbi:family 1 glycosylhydrolase [Microbacterium sp. G2-8]|uniref:family 1 glycosylhydrolase n=1 Tax=Microbacterium sp. G2-8 TaxID=2842454 RepID=UPI001C8A5447|nr:family 1 glycosylhydrolase [Microbacterium sp. G2-8]
MTFPKDFYWGVASAGHQNEGDNSHSDIWTLEHTDPTLFREPSGSACRAYDMWETDLDIVRDMGLNAYRFSVEWARIEPTRGAIDTAALDHYEQVVDGALERGITPLITFCHFAAPHWFAASGSWIGPEAPDLFAAHCDRVMERIGDRIGAGITLNEPNLEQVLQSLGHMPPEVETQKKAMLAQAAKDAGSDFYYAANIIPADDQELLRDGFLRAHRAGKQAIKARRADLPVGISIAIGDEIAMAGGEERRDAKREKVYDFWLREARNDDFIGVQNYERVWHGPDGEVFPEGPRNGMGTVISHASVAGAARYAHDVSGVPVLVSEHGIQSDDDAVRADFIPAALAELALEVDRGTPIFGYCHWTLMDNFEWIFGYGAKLGLVEVDRETFQRTPKPSAGVYADAVRRYRS